MRRFSTFSTFSSMLVATSMAAVTGCGSSAPKPLTATTEPQMIPSAVPSSQPTTMPVAMDGKAGPAATTATTATVAKNPLLAPWTGDYGGFPAFDKVQVKAALAWRTSGGAPTTVPAAAAKAPTLLVAATVGF